MTRLNADDCDAQVRRILTRYLVEVVETYDLCPWARAARVGGEVAIEIAWGAPEDADWIAAARRALARPGARVAMVVAPELAIARAELGAVRDRVAAAIADAGVAEFHPDAPLDLATPARAVPFARRAPDPLLQLVPLSLLAAARGAPPVADRAQQLAILAGSPDAPAPAASPTASRWRTTTRCPRSAARSRACSRTSRAIAPRATRARASLRLESARDRNQRVHLLASNRSEPRRCGTWWTASWRRDVAESAFSTAVRSHEEEAVGPGVVGKVDLDHHL